MIDPGIPTDDPDGRHDPGSLEILAVVSALVFLAAIVFSRTGDALLTGALTLGVGLLVAWVLY